MYLWKKMHQNPQFTKHSHYSPSIRTWFFARNAHSMFCMPQTHKNFRHNPQDSTFCHFQRPAGLTSRAAKARAKKFGDFPTTLGKYCDNIPYSNSLFSSFGERCQFIIFEILIHDRVFINVSPSLSLLAQTRVLIGRPAVHCEMRLPGSFRKSLSSRRFKWQTFQYVFGMHWSQTESKTYLPKWEGAERAPFLWISKRGRPFKEGTQSVQRVPIASSPEITRNPPPPSPTYTTRYVTQKNVDFWNLQLRRIKDQTFTPHIPLMTGET